MKKCLLIFLLLLSKTALSQLHDDFTDDNFTINPVWTGSNTGNDFVVTNQQLRSNSLVASSNFHLSTPSSLATNCRWEFWVNLKFATSGANYVDIYLTSDTANLQNPEIRGYFVRIGNTDDEISLYKRTGTSATNVKLIDGINGSVSSTSNNVVRVRVTRTASGQFKLERDLTGSGNSYFTEGAVLDNTIMTSAAFGILVQQSTSSFFQKHFFDDFTIVPLVTDSIPPQITSVRAIDSLTLSVSFSEPVDSTMAVAPSNYTLNPSIPIATITGTSNPLVFKMTLGQKLLNGSYAIMADRISDPGGNVILSDTLNFTYVQPYELRPGDVVINEIFADPSPQIDLPSVEYIELLNTTDQTIPLKNWKYADATSTYTFQQDSIKSQELLILCAKSDTAEFKKFGRVIGISPWPSLNNAGDSLRLVNEKGKSISEVSYTSSWYRNLEKRSGGWSLERIDPGSICQGITAWTASIEPAGGTPGRINSVVRAGTDSVNFKFEDVRALSDTTLQIRVNKPLDPATLDQVQYIINPPTGPEIKRELDITLQQIKLTFRVNLAPGTDYSILAALPDCDGNNWTNISFKTAALPPSLPIRTDTARIMINEIFADPSPEIGMPLIEFVEIYNPGMDTIDLQGWNLADSTSKGMIKAGVIAPGGFTILCPVADTAQYQKYGNTIGISPWPALSNSGKKIRLMSFNNRKVDSVAYSDSWYKDGVKKQGGWSLERIDPLSKCQGNTAWAASINPAGGTPGALNSVFYLGYAQIPWKVDSVKLISDTSIVAFLNRPLDPSWIPAADIVLTPTAGNFKPVLSTAQTQMKLTFNQKFAAGTNYSLQFRFSDCMVSVSLITAFNTRSLPPPPPVRLDTGKIIITEIFADPSPEVGLPLAEFIEIVNPGTDPIDLTGWTLSDPTVKSVIKKGLIAPAEYVILCPIADTLQYQPFGRTIGLAPWPSLNNGSDQLALKSFSKRTVDSVAYRDSWYRDSVKVAGGWSLELINFNAECPGKSNWMASKDSRGGTPGQGNSVAGIAGSQEPLRLQKAELKDSVSVLLTFSKALDSLAAADVSNYQLNNGAGHPQSVVIADEKVTLLYAAPITRGYNYRVTVTNVSSCGFGLITAEHNRTEFFYPHPIRKGDLVINEVLFNPRAKGSDFVEIYNNSKNSFDLKELQLATLDDDSLRSIKPVSPVTRIITPREYIVFTADPENIKSEYRAENDRLIGMKALPGFNDDAGDVVLLSNDQIIDHLKYSEKMHFKLIKDPEGVSLERSSAHRSTNEPGNFRSAAASAGFATPGYQNSQFVEEVSPEDEVALLSKTFSPDNDGFEDALEIHYKFTEPGWVANASVITDRGIPVRKIASNMTLGATGVITWDGLNESDQKAPVGIYMLYLEIFNQKGQVKKYRRSFALAARLD